MTRLMDTMLSGTDAWSREARQLWEQATRLGLAPDEKELALLDVRDLQALRVSLDGQHSTTPTKPRWTALLAMLGVQVRAQAPVQAPVRRQVLGTAAPVAHLA
jgi:hypothetical protein